ncbi:glycoside hydrolase-1 [Coleophoma cylindrospora]|uniref:beta-N-acetylhexosaminidase n=1 Tax=Coleophoma cylindrospora TaxID=1849047 RepID=A0A3D8S0J9_9HELO|nr:glycoside hydrolase-1 [Coleophoma cylindrospora]
MQFTLEVVLLFGALLPTQTCARLLGIPTVPFVSSNSTGTFSLDTVKAIVVDAAYKDTVNNDGETLIPPTLLSFAETFSSDLSSSLGLDIPVTIGNGSLSNSIFLTLGNSSEYLDAAGRPTSEGYSLAITANRIVVKGASPLGAWWATRTIMQQAIDAGRYYYPPEFIIEMCSYLSFFKQNTFHVHMSDASNLNPNIAMDRKLSQYSGFRPNSPDPVLAGLNIRPNESYYQSDMENMQQSCASRGVTIVPEFDTPGHSLVITQWKPELALSTDFSMLNISYPDTIPTLETIWSTFLPWFHSKTVHLGADEYSSLQIPEYNNYVNTLHDYIGQISNKSVRIWGTFPPSDTATVNGTQISTDVSIQHWEFFEANPYFDFIMNNYSVLNSDDGFYAVNKWSGSYPQKLNLTRVFYGAPGGLPYAPNIFSTSNATDNPPRDNPLVLGQMPVLWNDFGPNVSSVIEAYYAVREGLPALGDKQWGGDLLEDEYNEIFETLHAAIPGQNLDRFVASKTSTIFSYDFTNASSIVTDKSGNGYDGKLNGNCSVLGSVLKLRPGCSVTTPLASKGRNYTLSFAVKPTSSVPGTLFSGNASTLKAGNGSIDNVMFITHGNSFVLNYTLPVGSWTNVDVVAINNATYLSVTPANSTTTTTYEFTATLGYYENSFVWGIPMSIEAPISAIGGDDFQGEMRSVTLKDGANPTYASMVAPLVTGLV